MTPATEFDSRTSFHAVKSLPALLDAQAASRGAATAAISDRGGRIEEASWGEVGERVRDLAEGLASLQLARGDRIALLAETSLEAVLADLAIMAVGAVSVPIYVSSTPAECEHFLADSGATWIFCDSQAQADKIERVRGALPALRGILRLDAAARGPFERSASEVACAGAVSRAACGGRHAERVARIGPGDPACIVYTSGTTGRQKGAALTHANWLYGVDATLRLGILRQDDVCLLFLPIAHAFGRACLAGWLGVGDIVAFASPERIVEDARLLRPTIIPAPPRLFEKLHASVVAAGSAEHGVKRRLFRLALDELHRGTAHRVRRSRYESFGLALARRIVLPRLSQAVSEKLGGRVRILLTASAPLSPHIFAFFDALGFTMLEAFGMTECGGAAAVNVSGKAGIGTVGPPLPGTEIRIAADGEILLRNPGVMQGYWGNPEATAEAIADGWLHTGDVGVLDERGYLAITDRKKDIIATSGGKKVAPQNIEAALKAADPLVSQAVVHGDRRKYLVALLTLDDAQVRNWAASEGFAPSQPASQDPRIVARLQRAVDAVNAELPRHATLKRFAILPDDLAIEMGELTPTMKLRRRFCEERYAGVLDSLYASPGHEERS